MNSTAAPSATSIDEKEFLELSSPVLAQLSVAERQLLYQYLVPRQVAAEAPICGWDSASRPPGLFFVVSGEVLLNYRPHAGRFRPREVVEPGGVFGAPLVAGIEPADFEAHATTFSRLLLLPSTSAPGVLARIPALASMLELLGELARRRHVILPALRRVALLSSTSPRHLVELLAEAKVVRIGRDEELVRQGDAAHGFYYLLDGELHLLRDAVEPNRLPALVHVVLPDDVVGDAALVDGDGREPVTIVARRGPARLIHVPVAAWRGFLERSVVLQRSIAAYAPGEAERARRGPAAIVLPMSSVTGLPMAQLTDLLAQTVARDHGDRVLLMKLTAPDAARQKLRLQPIDFGERHIDRLVVPVDDAKGARAALATSLSAVETDYDLIFLDASSRGPEITAALGGLVHKVVLLTDDTFGPLPAGTPPVRTIIPSALLGRMRLRERGPAFRAGTVRLRLDLAELARDERPDFDRLPGAAQATFRRWGRAVTDRRVGVALGGGGAWGYAHVALLRAMAERDVPVDMVSGASFGSVIGSYFAARGAEGLDLLMNRMMATQLAIQAGMVSLVTIEWLVNRDLDGVLLEELEVPFFPASTDLGTGSQRVIHRGTIGFGVRASGSFPGVFAATRVQGARYVDGAISSNVPDDVLMPEGATLTVASNIVAEPPATRPARPLLPGALGRFLDDINPLRRAQDLVRGTMIMLHTVSNMDASTSDVLFESPPVPYWFWQSGKGREIEESAMPRAREVAEQIARRYQALHDDGHRGDDLS